MTRSHLRRIAAVPIVLAVIAAALAVVAAPAATGPAAAAVLPGAGQYVPLNPSRIVARQAIEPTDTFTFSPLGLGGVPTANVSAVAFTMTGRSAGTGNGQFIVYPAGPSAPGTSNVNYRPDFSTTNSVTVRLGTGGQVSVTNSGTASAATLWVDVLGYYTASTATGSGSTYVGLTPTRLLDEAPVNPDAPRLVSPLGKAGVPAADVSAVVVNIVVHGNGTAGEALAYPEGVSRLWHTMVFYQGDFVYTNQVAVKLGTGGQFRIHTTTATTVDVDVVGYFQAPAGTAAGGSFTATDPRRLAPVILGGGQTHTFTPLGQGGIPASGVTAVAFNLSATQATNAHTLTVYPAGIAVPAPANQLSYRPGPWPTQQYVKIGTNGQVSIHNNGSAQVRLLIDLLGYYRAPSAPAAPSGVTGTPVDGGVSLAWKAPATDGGASVTGYRITANPGGQTLDTIDVTTAVFSGLTNGTPYTFTVAARNAAGLGPAGTASAAVTPKAPTAPTAPTGVTAQSRDRSAVVRWEKPDHGGAVITGYTVTATPGGATATVTAPTTSALVTGLTNGTAYTFAVTATNAAGTGAAGTSAPMTPGPTVPDVPGRVSASSAGNGSIAVEWTRPRYTGGSALTGYVVTLQPGGRTVTVAGTVTETTVTGLADGTLYTITVAARNATGTGAASAPSKPVRPEIRLKAGVRKLSPAAMATLGAQGPTRLTFTNAPAEITGLTVGTVIVADPSDRLPSGFVRRVTAISTSGTTTTVDGDNLDPSDVYEAGSFSIEGNLGEGSSNLAGDGVSAMDADGVHLTLPIPSGTLKNKIKVGGSIDLEMKVGFHKDSQGDKILTLSGTVKTTVTFEGVDKASDDQGDSGTKPKDRLTIGTPEMPALKAVGMVRPSINAQIYLWAEGSVDKGVKGSISVSQTVTVELNVSQLGTPPKFDYEATGDIGYPQFYNTASLKLGTGVDLIGHWAFIDVARLKFQPYADLAFKPFDNPTLVVKGCARIGAEGPTVFGKVSWKNDNLINRCPFQFTVIGAPASFPVTPTEARVARGGQVRFTGKNRFPANPVKWSVEGTGNGSIDERTGVYTAPTDKDGSFTIIAKTEKIGVFPAEEGRTVVRVGAPLKPTVTIATTSPAQGDNRVRITITAATGGTVPTSYRAYVIPNLAPFGRCAGYWDIPGPGTHTLADRLEGDSTYNCGLLPLGAQVKFRVYASNDIGTSEPADSNTITVTA